MARSKHNTTGNGTHRQRIFKYKESMRLFRLATIAADAANKVRAEQSHVPAEFEVTTDGAPVVVGPDAGLDNKEDGLGHAFEDQSINDTMREFKGMISNDKHEQLMETFVEENPNA